MSEQNEFEQIKAEATRQYRHNTDNSANIDFPRDGFVIAYDKETIDKFLAQLQDRLTRHAEQIEAAFREGHSYGRCGSGLFDEDEDWEKSDACAILTKTKDDSNE